MVQVPGLRHCFQKFIPWLTSKCNCGKWPWVIWQFDVWKWSMDTQDKVSAPRADFRVKEKEGPQSIVEKHTGPRQVRILLMEYDNEWGKLHHAASSQNPNEAKQWHQQSVSSKAKRLSDSVYEHISPSKCRRKTALLNSACSWTVDYGTHLDHDGGEFGHKHLSCDFKNSWLLWCMHSPN